MQHASLILRHPCKCLCYASDIGLCGYKTVNTVMILPIDILNARGKRRQRPPHANPFGWRFQLLNFRLIRYDQRFDRLFCAQRVFPAMDRNLTVQPYRTGLQTARKRNGVPPADDNFVDPPPMSIIPE